MAIEEQVRDWMDHPQNYDIEDDEFASFMAWTILIAEQNGIVDELGNANHHQSQPKRIRQPTRQQIIMKIDEIRGD